MHVGMKGLTFFFCLPKSEALSLLCLLWIWMLPWISSCALESVASSDKRRAVPCTKHISDIYPQVACVNKMFWGDKYSLLVKWHDGFLRDGGASQKKKILNIEKKNRERKKQQLPRLSLLKTKLNAHLNDVFVKPTPVCFTMQKEPYLFQ